MTARTARVTVIKDGKERIHPMMSSVTHPVSRDFTAIDARRSAGTAWREQSVYQEMVPVQKAVMNLAFTLVLIDAAIINTMTKDGYVLMMNME